MSTFIAPDLSNLNSFMLNERLRDLWEVADADLGLRGVLVRARDHVAVFDPAGRQEEPREALLRP